jgi:hypothetical protein
MHWPPPKRLSPTPGKRGAKYSYRACDGSAEELYNIASIRSTEGAVNGGASLRDRAAASTQHSISAPKR